MADFFAVYESASEGDKLAREVWNGEQWVEAPATLNSRLHIESLVLQDAGGPVGDHWQKRMEDMAQDDWTVLP